MTTATTATTSTATATTTASAFEAFAASFVFFIHYGNSEGDGALKGSFFKRLYDMFSDIWYVEEWQRPENLVEGLFLALRSEGEIDIQSGFVRLKAARTRLLKYRLFLASIWQEKTGNVWSQGPTHFFGKKHRSWGHLTPTAKTPEWVSPAFEKAKDEFFRLYLEKGEYDKAFKNLDENMAAALFHERMRAGLEGYQRDLRFLEEILTDLFKKGGVDMCEIEWQEKYGEK